MQNKLLIEFSSLRLGPYDFIGHDDADESDDRADGRGHHELLLLSAHGLVASAHVEAGVGHHTNAFEAEASRKGIQKRLLDPIF